MAEKETSQNLSTQKTLLPGYDPGWNDPPQWAYNGAQSTATPTKRILNKRVAFPLTSTKPVDSNSPLNKPLMTPPTMQCPYNLTTSNNASLDFSYKNEDIGEAGIKIDKEQVE